MSFGDDLRAIREAEGISQAAMAERLGIDKQQVGAYERGIARPRAPRLADFERILGTRFSEDSELSEPVVDDPPKPRAERKSAPKGRHAAPSGPSVPLVVQLRIPYQLLGQVTAQRLPLTSQALQRQALPCAEAWDQFLKRYPALREAIEKGMIAGDILGLVMAHMPIIEAMRMEAAMRAQEQGYDGGINGPVAA